MSQRRPSSRCRSSISRVPSVDPMSQAITRSTPTACKCARTRSISSTSSLTPTLATILIGVDSSSFEALEERVQCLALDSEGREARPDRMLLRFDQLTREDQQFVTELPRDLVEPFMFPHRRQAHHADPQSG